MTTTGNQSTPPSASRFSSRTSDRDARGRYTFDEAALCTCGHPFSDHRDVEKRDSSRPRCDSPSDTSCRCDRFTPQNEIASAEALGEADAAALLRHSATERPRGRRLPFSPVMRLGCRVFSASLGRERELLGVHVTNFLATLRRADGVLEDAHVRQSSDNGYHCLSIVLFYQVPFEADL